MQKVRVTYWMTKEGKAILKKAAARVGAPQGAYVEKLVREDADRENFRSGKKGRATP